MIGSLVGTTGNSMMNVALPSIMDQFQVGLNVGVWIVTIYVLLFSTLMPLFGRLGDMFGYKRIYLVGMAGIVIWSAAAAVAPSIGWLIAFRVMSGIFNAPTLPAVMAIIAQVFPASERGSAMGFWATVNGAAHGLGPVISGWLVQHFGWPSIFWFNAAVALVGVVMIFRLVPPDAKRSRESFDLMGALTLTLAMILAMFNLTRGLEQGFSLAVNLALWGACFGLIALFLVSQTRARDPFVDLKLFTNAGYAVVTLVSGAQLFCLFGLQLLLPLYLIGVQGRPTGNAGLLIAPLAVTLALTSPAAGRLSDLVGSRLTCLIGMGLVALAGLGVSFWTAATSAGLIVVTLVLLGFGMGLTQSPTANAVTLVVGREKLGVALGIFNMLRFVSGSLGATIFGVLLAQGAGSPDPLAPFQLSSYLFAAVAAAAAVLALGLPRSPAPQAAAIER